jgi:hypothetical protein
MIRTSPSTVGSTRLPIAANATHAAPLVTYFPAPCSSSHLSLLAATGGMKQFPGLLKKIIANKAWERRLSKGKVIELTSLRELITEKPVRGWGEDVRTVEAVIKDDPEALAMFRDAMKGEPGRHKETDNNVIPLDTPQGNSKAYSIDRVKRECEPEVVALVMAKKKSAHAALVEAGVRKDRQVYINKCMAEFGLKLKAKLTADEIYELIKELSNGQ